MEIKNKNYQQIIESGENTPEKAQGNNNDIFTGEHSVDEASLKKN
jgi:hypothetical protein